MIQRSVLRAIIALTIVWVHGASPGYINHGLDWDAGACSSREWQSPINIDTILLNEPEDVFEFNYPVVNDTPVTRRDGALELDLRPTKGQLLYGGAVYNLRRATWHSDAEHLISGKRYPLELQLIHARPFHPASLIILSILFKKEEGEEEDAPWTLLTGQGENLDADVAQVWDAVADSSLRVGNFDLDVLLGTGDGRFVEYTGSQTSPPCMEGVTWLVKQHAVPLAKTQVEAFAETLHRINEGNGNFRSAAALNSRQLRVLQGEKKVGKKEPFVDAPPKDPLPLGPRPRTDGELQALGAVHNAIRATNEAKDSFKKLRERLDSGAYVHNVNTNDLEDISVKKTS